MMRKMQFFGQIIRKGCKEKCIIEGEVGGKIRGRQLEMWASDIVKFVGGNITDDREDLYTLVIGTAVFK